MMRISVLIPCYNAERYIGQALESVLTQDHTPVEIIVVDDGSTDRSADVAGRFGDRVRLYAQPNLGISAARNRCLALASGDATAFLDADDLWPAGSLSARAALLDQHPDADIAVGMTEQFISPELPPTVRATMTCPAGAMAGRLAAAMLIRRRAFDRVGTFDETLRVGETLDWVARADLRGVTTVPLERVVLHRRLHDSNTGLTRRDQRIDYVRALRASILRRRTAAADTTEHP